MLETFVLLNIFLETVILFQDSLMNKKLKEHHLFKKEDWILNG